MWHIVNASVPPMTPEIRLLRRRLENAKLRLDFAHNFLSEINSDPPSDGAFQSGARRAVLSAIATANAEYEAAFQMALKLAADATGAEMGTIQLFDRAEGVLKIKGHLGFTPPFLEFFARVQGHVGSSCGAALNAGRRVIVGNVIESAVFQGTQSLGILLNAGVQAVQSTPMMSESGELVGMFSTHYRKPTLPSNRDLEIIDELVAEATAIIAARPA